MCFYFVFTVFVTVGFGDIRAENTSERVLLLLLLLLLLLSHSKLAALDVCCCGITFLFPHQFKGLLFF
jgi:hypothetical protein